MDEYRFIQVMTAEFKAFLHEYGMTLAFPAPFSAVANGTQCKLNFIKRRDDFVCEIIDPHDSSSKNYFLDVVFSELYPDEQIGKQNKFGLTEARLHDIRSMFEFSKIKAILLGDFSWKPILKKKSDEFSAKRKFLLNHLPYDHPIARKASIGDISWLDDIEILMNESGRQ